MTHLHLPATRPALPSRRQTAAGRAAGFALGLALLFPVSQAVAQAPASAPPAPPPVVVQAPPLQHPPVAPPPPAGRPAAVTATGRQATVFPTLRPPPTSPRLPVDSVRSRATAVSAPPANAVAACKDGTYIVPPAAASACASHRGLQVAMTQPASPPAVTRVAARPVALVAAGPANAAPPAGATMRCKDGTWLNGTPTAGACAAHAGLAMNVPVQVAPPRPVAVTSPPRPAPKGTVQPPTAPAATKPAPARPPASAKPATVPPAPSKPATPPN